ncbi:hypothetical protein Sjap_001271 [Stephania japonica]|uniref:Uncharacterized protein n=1 Tax=Stephania japonica TaxID=461633 RepID=A0AAP0PUV8_9MAGN
MSLLLPCTKEILLMLSMYQCLNNGKHVILLVCISYEIPRSLESILPLFALP